MQVQKLKGKLTKSEELTMQQKSKLLAKQVEDTRNELRDGGVAVIKGRYLRDGGVAVIKGRYLRDGGVAVIEGRPVLERRECGCH